MRKRGLCSGRVWIGTSGWSYDDWRGSLYPKDIAKKELLRFYASKFKTAEINASFYRTPTIDVVRSWRSQTPDDFVFSWKASQFMTHWKRLLPTCENSIELMETRLCALGSKTGIVLFQLPSRFTKNIRRLSDFLGMLPRYHRYAFEFRDKTWYDCEALELLQAFNVALCISDHADAPAPWETTARHVYIRGHGPSGRYYGSYSLQTLRRWAAAIARYDSERRDVFVYFDNDRKAAAPKDAKRLVAMLED